MELAQTVKAEYEKDMAEIGKLEAQLAEKKKAVEPAKAYLISAGILPAPEKKKRNRKAKGESI